MDYRAKDHNKLPLKVSIKWRNLEQEYYMLTATTKSNSCALYYQDTSTNILQLPLLLLRGKIIEQLDTTTKQQCWSSPQLYLINDIISTKKPKTCNRLKILFSYCHFSGLDTYPQTLNFSQNSFYSSYKI